MNGDPTMRRVQNEALPARMNCYVLGVETTTKPEVVLLP